MLKKATAAFCFVVFVKNFIQVSSFQDDVFDTQTLYESYQEREIDTYVDTDSSILQHGTGFLKSHSKNLTKPTQALKYFADQVNSNRNDFHNTASKYPALSEFQTIVFKSGKEIQDIMGDLILFLRNPNSLDEQRLIINSYDKIGSVQTIGRILTNQTTQPLFDLLTKEIGHCDGAKILDAFWYLMGVYTEGCLATVFAEFVKFNGSKDSVRKQCISQMHAARILRQQLFENCRKEPCKALVSNIETTALENNITTLSSKLQVIYPWFYFTVLEFKKNTTVNLELFGHILNSMKIEERDETGTRLIVWSSRPSIHESSDFLLHSFGIVFSTDSLLTSQDNISFNNSTSNGRTRLTGYMEYPQKYRCQKTIESPLLNNESPDNDSEIRLNTGLFYFMIASIIVLFVALFVSVVYFKRTFLRKKFSTCLSSFKEEAV